MKCTECGHDMVEKPLFTSTFFECDFCIGRGEQLIFTFSHETNSGDKDFETMLEDWVKNFKDDKDRGW